MIRKKQGWWRDEFEIIDSLQQRSAQIEEAMTWKHKMNPNFYCKHHSTSLNLCWKFSYKMFCGYP